MYCWLLTLIPSDLHSTLNPEPASGRAASACFSSPLLPAVPQPAPSEHSQRVCLISVRSHITKESASVRLAVVSDSLRPRGLQPARLLCPWDSPGKNTGVDCHFLIQGIFLTQGSNPSPALPADSLPLSHWGSPTSLRDPLNDKGCVTAGA